MVVSFKFIILDNLEIIKVKTTNEIKWTEVNISGCAQFLMGTIHGFKCYA